MKKINLIFLIGLKKEKIVIDLKKDYILIMKIIQIILIKIIVKVKIKIIIVLEIVKIKVFLKIKHRISQVRIYQIFIFLRVCYKFLKIVKVLK